MSYSKSRSNRDGLLSLPVPPGQDAMVVVTKGGVTSRVFELLPGEKIDVVLER